MTTETVAVTAATRASRRPLSRVLVVSESSKHLRLLESEIEHLEVELTHITSFEELARECCKGHDIVVLDVEPSKLLAILQLLRKSSAYSEISILVDNAGLMAEPSLAGVLPQFRAMPCTSVELVRLVRKLVLAPGAKPDARPHYMNRML